MKSGAQTQAPPFQTVWLWASQPSFLSREVRTQSCLVGVVWGATGVSWEGLGRACPHRRRWFQPSKQRDRFFRNRVKIPGNAGEKVSLRRLGWPRGSAEGDCRSCDCCVVVNYDDSSLRERSNWAVLRRLGSGHYTVSPPTTFKTWMSLRLRRKLGAPSKIHK